MPAGKDTSYEGGGYVAQLGRVLLNAEVGLMYLASSGWLDRRTRGLFIEFVLYSPSANIFCDVCLFLERTAASSIQYIAKVSSGAGRSGRLDLELPILVFGTETRC